LYINPYVDKPNHETFIPLNLSLIPNEQILSKFLKTNFELVGDMQALAGSKDIKYSNKYDFEKFFSAPASIGDSERLCT